MIKHTIEDMKAFAATKEGECLSEKYINNSTKLKWKCKEGHEWDAAPHSILYRQTWCGLCAKCGKYTIEDMQELSKKREGECISAEYINSYNKLKWKCKEGHEWESKPTNVIQGRWCHICGKNKIKKVQTMTSDATRNSETNNSA